MNWSHIFACISIFFLGVAVLCWVYILYLKWDMWMIDRICNKYIERLKEEK